MMEGDEDMTQKQTDQQAWRQQILGELGAFRELSDAWHSKVQGTYWDGGLKLKNRISNLPLAILCTLCLEYDEEITEESLTLKYNDSFAF